MEGGELQDWELLVNSDTEAVNSPNSLNSNSRNFEEIEADSDGVLRLDYFSLENDNKYAKTVAAVVDASDEGSVDSDNPSWIDPGPETRFNQINNSGGFWSDSGSDRSDERKIGDFDVKNELGLVDNAKIESGFGIGEIDCKDGKDGGFECCEGSFSYLEGKNDLGIVDNVKNDAGFGDFGEKHGMDKDLGNFWSDSSGESLVFDDAGKMNEGSEISGESSARDQAKEENLSVVAVEEKKGEADEGRRKMVWWKVPFELLRYCVFRMSPVWTFSMAAAVMGFVILGRRLYKMKRKARSLPLKITVDDKFMSRAALLNEAFSVVKRVPIVRPLLPAAGVNSSWPVMTLR
ncbi:uncharacterized protein LOC126667754 isoform X2 [Mercurialis annua]|uniref:uncharacterized protein LOC126667754 isoform X2 n=1 Tax=Mercurialis annua TaxID=3986 RepID=UPI00215DFA24|nr:uncharacterized protein LOC126667754 isoform X2 [Mercurialis annua]